MARGLERLKSTVRLIEAAVAFRTDVLPFGGRGLKFIRSRWWHDATPEMFAAEIEPYFAALGEAAAHYTNIVDAGAAVGQFAIAACVRAPSARVHAFEPSRRQRLLLSRNARANHVIDRVRIWPLGLWNETTTLRFRTHGSLSSIASVSMLPKTFAFPETVPVTTLDQWADATPGRIDLIKMDIEGAEIEALEGARGVLTRDGPDLMVQAYHLRDGARTLERCAAILERQGYLTREAEDHPGLLLAAPRASRWPFAPR